MADEIKDVGVSRFALSVARMLDRLGEGEWELRLTKTGQRPRWVVVSKIAQVRTLMEVKEAEGEPPSTPANRATN